MEFVAFWTSMHWVVILLLVLALIFAVVEVFIPGFGICGTISIMLGVATVVVEGVLTKSVFNALLMFVLILIILIISFVIFILSAKKGRLSKSPIVEKETAIPTNYVKSDEKYALIGKIGVITSGCKPVGKAIIDEKEWTVISKRENIEIGKAVEVIEVKNNNLVVEEIKGGKNE